MVVVHLLVQGLLVGHYAFAILGEYTRFAAGGFIFVAGVGVGSIFLPKAIEPSTRVQTYQRLWRRSFYILCMHYTATLGFQIFALARGEAIRPLYRLVYDILTFRIGYDLLPFYVVMLALSPLMIEMVRRRMGVILAIASIGLFVWGRNHHQWAWMPIQQNFFIVLWQIVFVAGLLFGAVLPAYDRLSLRWRVVLACAATVAMVTLSLMAFGWHFNLVPHLNWIWFVKVPLAAGEMLRYLAFIIMVITVSDVLWRWIGPTFISAMVQRLGRRSLAIYIAHIFVVGFLVPISYRHPLPELVQIVYMPIAVVMLWAIAWGMDAWNAGLNRMLGERGSRWRFRGMGLALTAVVLLVVIGLWSWRVPPPARPPVEEHGPGVSPPTILGNVALVPVAASSVYRGEAALIADEELGYAGISGIGRTEGNWTRGGAVGGEF
jgi:hypothetical protein